jgi:hypothetical protein
LKIGQESKKTLKHGQSTKDDIALMKDATFSMEELYIKLLKQSKILHEVMNQ